MTTAPPGDRTDRLPAWRIGAIGGLVGVLCCVGPPVLALLGIVSAGTAFVWATELYDDYAWWFRLAGLAVLAVLAWISLRRRNQCTVAGIRLLLATSRRRRWRGDARTPRMSWVVSSGLTRRSAFPSSSSNGSGSVTRLRSGRTSRTRRPPDAWPGPAGQQLLAEIRRRAVRNASHVAAATGTPMARGLVDDMLLAAWLVLRRHGDKVQAAARWPSSMKSARFHPAVIALWRDQGGGLGPQGCTPRPEARAHEAS
jgi:hypothetical protein